MLKNSDFDLFYFGEDLKDTVIIYFETKTVIFLNKENTKIQNNIGQTRFSGLTDRYASSYWFQPRHLIIALLSFITGKKFIAHWKQTGVYIREDFIPEVKRIEETKSRIFGFLFV